PTRRRRGRRTKLYGSLPTDLDVTGSGQSRWPSSGTQRPPTPLGERDTGSVSGKDEPDVVCHLFSDLIPNRSDPLGDETVKHALFGDPGQHKGPVAFCPLGCCDQHGQLAYRI